MYLCICNRITKKNLEEYPQLIDIIGTSCGKCISDGGDQAFDRADESLIDNSIDSVTVK